MNTNFITIQIPVNEFAVVVIFFLIFFSITIFNFIVLLLLRNKLNRIEKKVIFLEGKVDSKTSTNNNLH